MHKAARAQSNPVEIAFMLQDWDDAYNVGGMFRVADVVGAVELVATGKTPIPPNPMVSVTSLGHHRRIPIRHIAGHEEAAKQLKAEGYAVIAIEIADDAVPYNEFTFPEKACFVLGNEERGIYGSVLKHCDAAVFIPMFGKGRSMNVHVSAAVVAFQARCGGSATSSVESE